MNKLFRGVVILALVGLVTIVVTGAVHAQEEAILAPEQMQPHIARQIVANWENAHPLDYYLALPVNEYIQMAYTPNWASANPMEYYLAFPVDAPVAQEQYNRMLDVAQGAGR